MIIHFLIQIRNTALQTVVWKGYVVSTANAEWKDMRQSARLCIVLQT